MHQRRTPGNRQAKEQDMNDLLTLVVDAHGGLERWSRVSTLTARLAAGGPFWGLRGFADAFLAVDFATPAVDHAALASTEMSVVAICGESRSRAGPPRIADQVSLR